MLAAGTAASASFSTIGIGLPAVAPALRSEYELTLTGLGLLLAAGGVGLMVALLPWGLVTDRIGERRALGYGLGACGALTALAAVPDGAVGVGVVLAAAAAAGASVQSASGRAVMQWFRAEERGLAFGIRQTAVPLGGLIGALALPPLVDSHGVRAAFVALGAFCAVTALVGLLVVRDLPSEGVDPQYVPWTLRDSRLWLLCTGSGFYVVAQLALFSFLVVFLHDEEGFSPRLAAAAFAVAHVIAVATRIGAGRWSDLRGSRIVPLRRIGLATFGTLAVAAVLLDAPTALVVALLVAATALSASWNGLSFVAAAELAGPRRSGAAIGFQQTALALPSVLAPPLFGALVEAASWRVAFAAAALFPLAGWAMLAPLRERV